MCVCFSLPSPPSHLPPPLPSVPRVPIPAPLYPVLFIPTRPLPPYPPPLPPNPLKAKLFNLLFLQTYIWIFFFLLPTRSSSGSAFSLICVHPEFFMTPLLPPPPGFDPIITHKVTSPYHHCLGTFLFVVLSRGWPLVYLSYFLL